MALSKVPAAALASGAARGNFGAGAVLQVANNLLSDHFIVNTTTATTIWTGSNLALKDSSSKVLFIASFSLSSTQYGGAIKLQYSTNSGSTWNDIATADPGSADGTMNGVAHLAFHHNLGQPDGQYMSTQNAFHTLHAPNSSQVMYRLQAAGASSSYSIAINRRGYDNDWGGHSWVTQMEIAG